MIKVMQRAISVAVTVMVAGCASTGPTSQPSPSAKPASPAQSRQAAMPAPAQDERVIVDSALDRTIRVLKVISDTRSDGLLEIQVIVKNITDSSRWFSYRVEWFDVDGKLVPLTSDGSLSWMLLAGETSSIFATAPAITAKDFGVAFLAAAQ
jgi:uncharacterized protein YcfL